MIAVGPYGYVPGMRAMADKAEFVAACDTVDAQLDIAERQFGARERYHHLEDMLAKSDIDVVLNLTPIPLHGATTIQILQAGKHVVTEKPLATTMEDADTIVDLANKKNLLVIVAPPNMIQPTRRLAKQLVEEGAIGQVCFARVRGSHGGPASGNWPMDPTWFYQEGSGPLFDMGVYGIHDITGILGPAKRVVAFSGITEPVRTVRGGPFKGKKITVTADDNTLLMLDFGNSAFAVVDGTFNVNAAKSPGLEIFGRTGTISIQGRQEGAEAHPPLELFKLDAVPGVDGWIAPRSGALVSEQERQQKLRRAVVLEHLVDCLWEKQQPVLSVEHGRHALEIMLKATESARQGRVLDLETTF
jgi:predicted dehydrogenase